MSDSVMLVPYRLESIGDIEEHAKELKEMDPLRLIWQKEGALLLVQVAVMEGDTDPLEISDIIQKCQEYESIVVQKQLAKKMLEISIEERNAGRSPVGICVSSRKEFSLKTGLPESDQFFGVPILEDAEQDASTVIILFGKTTLAYLYGAEKIVYLHTRSAEI